MKKILYILLLTVLAGVLAGGVVAEDEIPTLFHNDEAWYKDEIAPALPKDGILHVPSDLLAMFDYITFTTEREGENLLFQNTRTGDYVSILYSDRAACVNGWIVENVSIFREKGYYYLDLEFITANLGLLVEYSAGGSVRVYDESCVMTFPELLAVYEEAEEAVPVEPELEKETEPQYAVRIYLLVKDSARTDTVFARDLAERSGFGYTRFLTADSELSGLNFGKETGISPTSLAQAEELNDRLAQFCRVRTHLALATGEEETDKTLAEAGYYLLTPEFTVTKTTDAQVLFEEMIQYVKENDTVTILLGDVWQSETLLIYLQSLDQNYYRIGGLSGVN